MIAPIPPALLTGQDFDGARERLRGLAARWRAQPWYPSLVAAAPGPVAHEVQAFADVVDAGDAGGALLQLRDTVETLLKFVTLALARDFIANGPASDAALARRALLARPLSLGSWWAAGRDLAERITRSQAPHLSRPLALPFTARAMRKAIDAFVQERNAEIGHGAFRRNPGEQVAVLERVAFDPAVGAASIFAAVADVAWPRLELVHEDSAVPLAGAAAILAWHQRAKPHDGAGEAVLSARLVFPDGGDVLDLAPYVAGRVCRWCGHQDVFLFDAVSARKPPWRFDFLDYVQGHKSRWRDAAMADETDTLAEADRERTAAALDLGQTSQRAIEELERAADAARYLSPDYLRKPLFAAVEAAPSSVTWLQAPAHVGKSAFARGLADPQADRPDPPPLEDLAVAGVFIKREWRAELPLLRQRLLSALIAALAINPDLRERLPVLQEEMADKPTAMARLLEIGLALRGDPGKQRLLLVIDGLDELAPSEAGQVFLDFLPRPEQLPEGVHVLLTSRRHGDPDCPAWLDSRLASRLNGDGVHVQRLDLDDPDYVDLMRQYVAEMLAGSHRPAPTEATFARLLEKAEGLFLYLSFLVEQVALGRLAVDRLDKLPTGGGLFTQFLTEFKRDLGSRHLAEEAELILLALAAEELAHGWCFGDGLLADYAGVPLLVDDPDWRGVTLEELAGVLDRDGPDGAPDGFFLYALYRLKAAIGVHRGGGGEGRFRLWLKDLARGVAADATLAERLRALHARAATRALDAAVPQPRALAHAVLSGSEPVRRRALLEDTLLDALFRESRAARAAEVRYRTAIRASNAAVGLLLRRGVERAEPGLIANDMSCLAAAYAGRGSARNSAGDARGAIADYEEAIRLHGGLQTWLGAEFPPAWENDLAGTLVNRGLAREAGGDPRGAIADYDEAIRLREGLRARLGAEFPASWEDENAAAHMNRGNARDAAGDVPGAIADYDEAIRLRSGLRAGPGAEFPPSWENDLAQVHMNRGVARRAVADASGAIADLDEAIRLRRGLRYRLGAEFPPSWEHDLAAALMNRGAARDFAGDASGATADYDEAIRLLEGLRNRPGAEIPPPLERELAVTYTNRGLARDLTGDAPGAIADYDEAIRLLEGLRAQLGAEFPPPWEHNLAAAHMSRGLVRMAAGDASAAIADLDEAIRLREAPQAEFGAEFPDLQESSLATAHVNRGLARNAAGDARGAIADADEAIRLVEGLRDRLDTGLSPDCEYLVITAHTNRGNARESAGDLHGAMADHRVAIDLALALQARMQGQGYSWPPSFDEVLSKAQGNLLATAKSTDEAALAAAIRWLAERGLLPGLATAHMNRGNTLYAAGDASGAIADYDEAIRLTEGLREQLGAEFPLTGENALAAAHMSRGKARQSAGNPREAIADYQVAIDLALDMRARMQGQGYSWPPSFDEVLSKAQGDLLIAAKSAGQAALAAAIGWLAERNPLPGSFGNPAITAVPRTEPVPPPILPGEVVPMPSGDAQRLGHVLVDLLGSAASARPVVIGVGVQLLEAPRIFVITIIFAGPAAQPGAIDVLLVDGEPMIFRSDVLFPAVLRACKPCFASETATTWAAFALAGPWADPPRRLLCGVHDIPWVDLGAQPLDLLSVQPPTVTAFADSFHIEAQWLRGAELAAGTIRLQPDGAAIILHETIVASGLGIWSWAYDGPFRVAVDLRS